MTVRVSSLTPEQKAVFETLLGRPVEEYQQLEITAYEHTPTA